MNFDALRQILGLGGQKKKPEQAQRPTVSPSGQALRTPQQIQQAPPKLFEDGSFQGNPQVLKKQNPGFTFYEDNSFSAPKVAQPQPNLRQQSAQAFNINNYIPSAGGGGFQRGIRYPTEDSAQYPTTGIDPFKRRI